jgi:hypothetical protein
MTSLQLQQKAPPREQRSRTRAADLLLSIYSLRSNDAPPEEIAPRPVGGQSPTLAHRSELTPEWETNAVAITNFDDFRDDVFSMIAEDGHTGVYQAWWRANAAFPDAALSTRLEYAERALNELLRDGLIQLSRGKWDTDEYEPVGANENDSALRAWDTWTIPNGPTLFFSGTEKGFRHLERLHNVEPGSLG